MTLVLALVLAAAPGVAEVQRIQQHLSGAQALLAARDVSGLSVAQRANRELNAQRLAAYKQAGEFPKNRVQAGRTPVFRDDDGTRCAVGELLWRSGETALVDDIATNHNLATIHELAVTPGVSRALGAWLDAQGLTLAEAARIQPSYDFMAFEVTTPAYTDVAVGACSPPMTLRPAHSATPHYASASVTPAGTKLFKDADCTVELPLNREVTTDGSIHFRAEAPGAVTIKVSGQANTVTQVHRVGGAGEVTLPYEGTSGGNRPVGGCSTSGSELLLLLSLAVLKKK